MMKRPRNYKRMVLGLPHSQKDYVSVAFAAELAAMLGVDLVGIFAGDGALAGLAELPCVREFRFSGGWRRLDAGQIERGSNQAAAEARRLFAEAVKALRTGSRFDLASGSIGDIIGSQSAPDDIVVVIEPKNPAERVTYQFRHFLDAALAAPAATLLVPSHISRRSGPVVAIATSGEDSSISAALRVAESSREKLLVLAPADADENIRARLAAAGEVAVDRRPISSGKLEAAELSALLARIGERFVVLSRQPDPRLPFRLSSEQAVPVLVTEPN
jgi:hypothetical protein